MTTETEIGLMLLEAKELQVSLETLEAKRKAWNTVSLRAFRESMALTTP